MQTPHFLLVGNGPYLNRGCEAIVRGTTRIIDATFGHETNYLSASFGSAQALNAQANSERNSRIQHTRLVPKGRMSIDYLKFQMNRFAGTHLRCCGTRLPVLSPRPLAVLQIGGDNYTLDYGYPRHFMEIDREIFRMGIPLVLWGASVGPFDADRAFEKEMAQHLAMFSLITVREERSFRYLRGLGLSNLCHVADPAFMMEPQPVAGMELPAQFVGINLSPLTAGRAAGGHIATWTRICADAVRSVVERLGIRVVLIPHVTSHTTRNDDSTFLRAVAALCGRPSMVAVLERTFHAAELKWIISRACTFAGARTHSTIASISSGVPTISLAYSVKAWGINEDVFGHTDFCMDVAQLIDPDALAGRIGRLMEAQPSISRDLHEALPRLRAKAMDGGSALKQALELP